MSLPRAPLKSAQRRPPISLAEGGDWGCEIVGGLRLLIEHGIVGTARDTRMTMVELPTGFAEAGLGT